MISLKLLAKQVSL